MIGETDIILKRSRLDTYKARNDCYILKLNKPVFEKILDEFPDIREDIFKIVIEREKKRLDTIQNSK